MAYAEGPARGFLEGKLLIAMPSMPDPRFEKSVIYMCAHNDDGAMGVIINKAIDGLALSTLLEKLSIPATPALSATPVFYGGPVRTANGFVLHTDDYQGIEKGLHVGAGIVLTATADILRAIGGGKGPEKFLMALGYAGWGDGQIESEIKSNGWLHCDADREILFETPAEDKWRLALARLGAGLSGLSGEAGRA